MTTEKLFALSLGLAGFIFMAQQARADAPSGCGAYAAVTRSLQVLYGEVPAARRGVDAGAAVELLASPASGTWTLIAVQRDGTACLVSSGRNWPVGVSARVRAADRT